MQFPVTEFVRDPRNGSIFYSGYCYCRQSSLQVESYAWFVFGACNKVEKTSTADVNCVS